MKDEKNQTLLLSIDVTGEPKIIIDQKSTKKRYLVLTLACFLCFGNYFVYDNPSPLQPEFMSVLFI